MVVVDVEKFDDLYIPTSGSATYTSTYHGGKRGKYRYSYSTNRSDIQINPNFKEIGAFVMDGIPEGTKLWNRGDIPGLRYVWRNGKAVPDLRTERQR